MRGQPGVLRVALALSALLVSLILVVRRQSRALELLREGEALRQERAVLEAERALLERRIQRLESRGSVVAAASERLGLHIPVGEEIVVLPLGESGAEGAQ